MTQSTNEQLYQLRTKTISDGVGSTTTNFIASARGAMLRDVEDREYIDFAGGIGMHEHRALPSEGGGRHPGTGREAYAHLILW